jgi:hypothetical protein
VLFDIPYSSPSRSNSADKGNKATDTTEANLRNVKPNRHHQWTDDHLVTRLKQHLANVKLSGSNHPTDLLDNGKQYDSRKYYNQAYHYLRLGACSPTPSFLVSLSELSPILIKHLAELEKNERQFLLKQAVGRIIEDINFKLYHDSVSKVLTVKIVK